MENRRLGALGERAAEQFLSERGAKIVERNMRCPMGEIDLIVRMDGFLCFVEVKSRSSAAFGRPAEAVGKAKRAHIVRAAWWYLKRRGLKDTRVRFDVVEVSPLGIRHLPGAFEEKDP